jgi:formylglycine-generating enzyme required for sulfatase activity
MTHPVGTKLPNDWGFYDMYGNVQEWCNDYWMEHLGTADATDPVGPVASEGYDATTRIVRGAHQGSPSIQCRSADRYASAPTWSYTNFGFRVVWVVP